MIGLTHSTEGLSISFWQLTLARNSLESSNIGCMRALALVR